MQLCRERLAVFPTILHKYQQNYLVTGFSELCAILIIAKNGILEKILYLLRMSLFTAYIQLCRKQLASFPTIVQKYQPNYFVTCSSEQCAILQITLSCIMENIFYLRRKSLFTV